MGHPWAADLVTTGLVLLLIDTLVPVTDAVARVALDGAWPWAVAVAGFLALRVVVAGIYAAMRFAVERLLPSAPVNPPGRPSRRA